MKTLMTTIGIAIWITCAPTAALAQAKTDFGKEEYESKCANCHGLSGKGDGSLSRLFTRKPTDLTALAKTNGGVFPVQRVYEFIDGRLDVAAHGPRDMPIWGREYRAKAPDVQSYYDLRSTIAEAKILALVDYLSRLQDKK